MYVVAAAMIQKDKCAPTIKTMQSEMLNGIIIIISDVHMFLSCVRRFRMRRRHTETVCWVEKKMAYIISLTPIQLGFTMIIQKTFSKFLFFLAEDHSSLAFSLWTLKIQLCITIIKWLYAKHVSVIYFHIRLEYKVKKKYLSRSCRIPGGQALFLLWKLEEAGVQLTYWVVRPLATFSAVGCCKA